MLTEPDTGGRKPLYSARLLMVGAALAGVLIFALVAVLAHRGSGQGAAAASVRRPQASDPGTAQAPPSSAAAPTAPASAAASDGSCDVPPGNQAIPTSAPAGVTWQIYDTVALPFSAQAGPTVISGDVARCYAHSPTGALLAVAQVFVRIEIASDWQAVLDEQVMPGTGKKVFASERPSEDVTVAPGEFGQFVAFQFVTYSPAVAAIQLVVQLPDGTLQEAAMTVTWSDGDWRLDLLPDGQPNANVAQLSSLSGFIAWGGI